MVTGFRPREFSFFLVFFFEIIIFLTILLFFCSFGWQRDFGNGKLVFFWFFFLNLRHVLKILFFVFSLATGIYATRTSIFFNFFFTKRPYQQFFVYFSRSVWHQKSVH